MPYSTHSSLWFRLLKLCIYRYYPVNQQHLEGPSRTSGACEVSKRQKHDALIGTSATATGDLDGAISNKALYVSAAQRAPESRRDYPNRIVDILKVATAMLGGEIQYRRGKFDAAFESLRLAIQFDDALMYLYKLWGWMVPTRHAFAALSLEQAYAEGLGLYQPITRAHQHPGSMWGPHGYHEWLVKLGRKTEAAIVKQQLDVALAVADVEIRPGVLDTRSGRCK